MIDYYDTGTCTMYFHYNIEFNNNLIMMFQF